MRAVIEAFCGLGDFKFMVTEPLEVGTCEGHRTLEVFFLFFFHQGRRNFINNRGFQGGCAEVRFYQVLVEG